jgi:hypothetical protein
VGFCSIVECIGSLFTSGVCGCFLVAAVPAVVSALWRGVGLVGCFASLTNQNS